jgi:hypothetical protein
LLHVDIIIIITTTTTIIRDGTIGPTVTGLSSGIGFTPPYE